MGKHQSCTPRNGENGRRKTRLASLCGSQRSAAARDPMEEVQAAFTAHLDQVSGLVQALSSELRSGIGPAADSLLAFVRAVDWTVPREKSPLPVCSPCIFPLELTNGSRSPRVQEPWLMCLMAFHAGLLLTAVGLRRNANLQFFFLFLACEFSSLGRDRPVIFAGSGSMILSL